MTYEKLNGAELLRRNKKRRKLRNKKRTPTERIFKIDLPKKSRTPRYDFGEYGA